MSLLIAAEHPAQSTGGLGLEEAVNEYNKAALDETTIRLYTEVKNALVSHADAKMKVPLLVL